MGDITLNQIRDMMLWLIAFVTATATIIKALKSAIHKGFEPINKKIDNVDMNATKNFLVRTLADIEKEGIDDVTKLRFFEQYEHYIKPKEQGGLGGNSYIKHEVERLQKEGKL